MKILIIESHLLFAECLTLLLKTIESEVDIFCVDTIEKGIVAIDSHISPDLILLNTSLSSDNVFCFMEEVQKRNVTSPVLVVSEVESPNLARLAYEKGASGFVCKSCNSMVFIEAINTMLNGSTYFPGDIQATIKLETESVARITSRQKEVLFLLSEGLLNKQIANELSISANTVKVHLHDIFRNLNASNRTSAVIKAQKYGLIQS